METLVVPIPPTAWQERKTARRPRIQSKKRDKLTSASGTGLSGMHRPEWRELET